MVICQNLLQWEKKLLDPEKLLLDKYDDNSSRGWVLEVHLEYPRELQEFHNDYPLVPDIVDIKRNLSSNSHLKIDGHYDISIGKVKN